MINKGLVVAKKNAVPPPVSVSADRDSLLKGKGQAVCPLPNFIEDDFSHRPTLVFIDQVASASRSDATSRTARPQTSSAKAGSKLTADDASIVRNMNTLDFFNKVFNDRTLKADLKKTIEENDLNRAQQDAPAETGAAKFEVKPHPPPLQVTI